MRSGLQRFLETCDKANVTIVVYSGGFTNVIRPHLECRENVVVVANELRYDTLKFDPPFSDAQRSGEHLSTELARRGHSLRGKKTVLVLGANDAHLLDDVDLGDVNVYKIAFDGAEDSDCDALILGGGGLDWVTAMLA